MSSELSHAARGPLQWARVWVFCGAAVLLAAPAATAHATPELPMQYDARSLGMGGTGVAHADNAAAVVVNPAGLSRIERLSVTGVFAPFMPSSSAPFSDNVDTQAERSFVPLFFAGGAYRLNERIVMGLAAYAASGAGARYDAIRELDGMQLDLSVAILELAVPVSLQLTDELSIGAGVRFSYGFIQMDLPVQMAAALPPARVQNSMSGTGFPGGVFGVQYKPAPFVSLGLSYRTKLTTDLEGDGDVTADFLGGQLPVVASASWSTAHAFRAGAETQFDELSVALDVTYTLLDDAVDTLPLAFQTRDGTMLEPDIQLQWRDSLGGFLGGEYVISKLVPVRAGYALINSGTPAEYAEPTMPPPGVMQVVTLGTGYRSGDFQVDLGGAYAFAGKDVEATPNGAAGRYDGDFYLVSTSLSYRH